MGLDGPQQAKEQQQAACPKAEEADGPEQGVGGLGRRVPSGWGRLAGLNTLIPFAPPREAERPDDQKHCAAGRHAVAEGGGHLAPVTVLDMQRERGEEMGM